MYMRMYENGGRFNLRVFVLIMASLFVWNISCVYYTVNKLLLGWIVGVVRIILFVRVRLSHVIKRCCAPPLTVFIARN